MGLRKAVAKATHAVAGARFSARDGAAVPTSDMLRPNGAVRLTGVFLCARLADSAELVTGHPQETSAKVVRAFLNAVALTVASRGGELRGFDAGRVTAVFAGRQAADRAARAALEIKWVIDTVVEPEVRRQLEPLRASGWVLRHKAGLDIGEVIAIRAGVRDRNDLVIVGDAVSVADELCELGEQRTCITDRLWQAMGAGTRLSGFNDDKPMWSEPRPFTLGPRCVEVRSSNWGWVVS